MRQLRRERENKEEKIYEAITKKMHEWETKKFQLENQIAELHSEIQKAKTIALSDLESAEKENSNLRLDLLSKSVDLRQRTFERGLITRATETGSKQHLDCIKKVAKLETECNGLEMVAREVAAANNHLSVTASSVYVESFMDNQSDNGERITVIENVCCEKSDSDMIYHGSCQLDSRASYVASIDRSIVIPSVDFNLLYDFLEMEQLAALPDIHSGGTQSTEKQGGKYLLRSELEVMTNQAAELEGILEKMDKDKGYLELALTKCQNQLQASENQLKETNVRLLDLSSQLSLANRSTEALQKEVAFNQIKA
ncbi:filament-like plant protein [Dorcoceras hygrometricum]|uniref:Filament-like plant protein n=1 Tax=Dorcoceras hygrometricum TaxID=472368 RepID=A0A2Z7AIL8_9LAMI|nr:filament-like plant protein [Dorcoceras hygrometricum]